MYTTPIGPVMTSSPVTHFREGHSLLHPPSFLQSNNGIDDKGWRDQTTRQSDERRHIAEAIYRLRNYEHDRKVPVQARADESWNSWNGEDDFGPKADWQESARIPKTWLATERMVSTYMQFLTLFPDWFTIEPVLPSQQLPITIVKNLIKDDLEDDRIGFFPFAEDTLREACLTGNCDAFVGYERGRLPIMTSDPKPEDGDTIEEEKPTESSSGNGLFDLFGKDMDLVGSDLGLIEERVDPASGKKFMLPSPNAPRVRLERIPFERVYRDSTGRKRYIIWATYSNKSDFRKEAEERGWDLDAAERAIHAQPVWSTNGRANVARDQAQAQHGSSPREIQFEYAVELTHIEGVLYDPATGESLFRGKYAVVANGELMFDPIDSPFWDGELPLVSGRIARNPQSAYGKSVIAENLECFDLQISLLHLLADALKRELHPAYEYDVTQLQKDPRTVPMGPGVMYAAQKNGTNVPAVTKIAQGSVDGNVANIFQMIQVSLDQYTAATQEGGGAPRSRNRMSGQEMAIRETQASTLQQFFFQNYANEFLAKVLRLWFLRKIQFISDREWSLTIMANQDVYIKKTDPPEIQKKNLEELKQMASWSAAERYKNLGAYFRFKVKVLGNAVQLQMRVEKWTSLLNIARQSPEMMQVLEMPYIMSEIVQALGHDATKAIRGAAQVPPEVDASQILQWRDIPEMEPPNVAGSFGPGMGIGSTPKGKMDDNAPAPQPSEFPPPV